MKRLLFVLLLASCAFAQMPKNPTGPSPTGGGVGGASALTTVNAIPKVTAAGVLGESTISDDGTNIYTNALRNYGFGTFARTGNTTPGTGKVVWWNKDMVVGNTDTLGSESLTNGALTTGTSWTRSGDMALTGDAAVYTHATGVGTLQQANVTLAVKLGDATWQILTYTVTGATAGVTWTLPATVCDTTVGLSCTPSLTAGAAKTFQFKSAASASTAAFLSNFTSTAGGVTIDDLSVKEIQGGALNLSGSLFARQATFYGGSGATSVVVRAGGNQSTTNIMEWRVGTNVWTFISPAGRFRTTDIRSIYDYWDLSLAGIWALPSTGMFRFSSGAFYNSSPYTGISWTSGGRLQINSGTAGKWAGLDVGSLYVNALDTPGAPTVTPTCTGTCVSTWTYTITALAGDSTTTIPGATGTTAVNATTLDGTHYNTVTWTAVTGATSYTVRRTVSGGTPATLGALATCTAITGLSCVDNGLVGNASTVPTGNTTGSLITKIQTPATAAVTCIAGAIWTDANFIYVCTASGVLKSVAIATF